MLWVLRRWRPRPSLHKRDNRKKPLQLLLPPLLPLLQQSLLRPHLLHSSGRIVIHSISMRRMTTIHPPRLLQQHLPRRNRLPLRSLRLPLLLSLQLPSRPRHPPHRRSLILPRHPLALPSLPHPLRPCPPLFLNRPLPHPSLLPRSTSTPTQRTATSPRSPCPLPPHLTVRRSPHLLRSSAR